MEILTSVETVVETCNLVCELAVCAIFVLLLWGAAYAVITLGSLGKKPE